MTEDVTILIANLGSYGYLQPCLKSVFRPSQSEVTARVVVGFNFPGESETPGSLARDFPQVEQFRAPMKLGYCRAYNQLMRHITGRYALLLDDDTLLPEGTIEGMVRFLDEHPDVGIAGCRTLNPDGSYQKTTALMYDLRSEVRNAVRPAAFWDDGIDDTLNQWREAGWLNGHFLMVRKEVVDAVGGLDEHYYTFQCEADWCLRIRRAGWKIAYVPGVSVTHIGGQHSVTSNLKSYDNLLRSHLNRYYFVRKHYSTGTAMAFRAVMGLGSLLRLGRYCAMWLVDRERRPEAGPKIRAYLKIMATSFAPRPETLPEGLRSQNELAATWP